MAIVILKSTSSNRNSGIARLLIATIFGGGALIADVFNTQVAQSMRINTERWSVASTLIRYSYSVEMPKKIISSKLFDYVGKPGPLPEKYWQKLFLKNAGINIEFSASPMSDKLENTARVEYDCPNKNDCLIIIQRYKSGFVEIISTNPRPRFIKYAVGSKSNAIKIDMILRQPPTFMEQGLYATQVPLNIDMSLFKIH